MKKTVKMLVALAALTSTIQAHTPLEVVAAYETFVDSVHHSTLTAAQNGIPGFSAETTALEITTSRKIALGALLGMSVAYKVFKDKPGGEKIAVTQSETTPVTIGSFYFSHAGVAYTQAECEMISQTLQTKAETMSTAWAISLDSVIEACDGQDPCVTAALDYLTLS